MRTTTKLALAGLALIVLTGGLLRAQQDETIYDEDLKYVSSAPMKIPPLAGMARITGVVVVKVNLDRHGKVVEATAISGHPLLAQGAVANAKTWKFEPNPQRRAILVYEFRFGDGCVEDDYWILRPPNVVESVLCDRYINTSSTKKGKADGSPEK